MDHGLWAEIRRLCLGEGLSQREVAKRLLIDRGTVKRALAGTSPPEYKAKLRGSRLDTYKGLIKEIIDQYPKLSAVRIFEQITKRGYSGSITLIKNYLRRLRGGKKEAFLRIETLAGDESQVDWTDCGRILIDGAWRRLSCFVMVLSYSRLLYLEFTLSQKLEDFIQCHINAFRYFGGVPKKILYDNVRTVVLWRMKDKIGFNSRFMDFVGIYLFEPKLCKPYRATDKGKVENIIKYIKGNFLAGRDFKDFEDLQRQAMDWLETVANVRIHGTTRQRPIDRFQEEKDKLMSLPEKGYDVISPVPVKSSSDCRIKFDSNIYSIPPRYANQILSVKATKDEVFIYYKNKLITRHRRSWGKYKVIEDPKHCRGLLELKKKAIVSKIKDEFLSLGKVAEEYFKGLSNKDSHLPNELARILKLRHIYGVSEILQAMADALKYSAYGASYIENIIIANRTRRGEPIIHQEISLPESLANTQVEERHPSIYDVLLREKEDEQS
jgi:transposase